MSLPFSLIVTLMCVTPTAAMRHRSPGAAARRAAPALCAPEVVEETCSLLRGSLQGMLKEILSAKPEAIDIFQNALGLDGNDISCESVCSSVVKYFSAHGHTLPPKSDIGCYTEDKASIKCDLDLSEGTLAKLAHVDGNLPDFHDRRALKLMQVGGGNETVQDRGADQDYDEKLLLIRVANLFRIYPMPTFDYTEGPAVKTGGVSAKNNWRKEVQKRNVQAQAYVATAIRKFNGRQTETHIKKWFGPAAFTSGGSRHKIQGTLNSIDNVLAQARFSYPGGACDDRTYAYVFPYGAKTIYLCELYMKSPVSVQIETLTHEASHHATAFTEDFDYERDRCERLALDNPMQALDNADSYCYYIQDITDKR